MVASVSETFVVSTDEMRGEVSSGVVVVAGSPFEVAMVQSVSVSVSTVKSLRNRLSPVEAEGPLPQPEGTPDEAPPSQATSSTVVPEPSFSNRASPPLLRAGILPYW